MKICYVIDESIYRYGGVQYILLNFITWLAEQGHEVTILHCPNPGIRERPLHPQVEVIEIAKGFDIKGLSLNGSVSPFPGFASQEKIDQILHEKGFDIIHFSYAFSPFVSGRILRSLRKLDLASRPKVFLTFMIYVEEKFIAKLGNKMLGFALNKALKTVDTFIGISRPACEYGEKYAYATSILIPPALPAKELIKKQQSVENLRKIQILFMGRHEYRKGIIDLIEALNIVNKKVTLSSVADITIAGDGPVRAEAEQLAKTSGLLINFPGKVNDEEKSQLYMEADIAIFPAKYGESCGLVLIEAMNYGCSVIANTNPGYLDTMENFPECQVPVNDIEKLAEKIQEFLENKDELIINLGERLKANFSQKFDIEVVGRKLEELYRS